MWTLLLACGPATIDVGTTPDDPPGTTDTVDPAPGATDGPSTEQTGEPTPPTDEPTDGTGSPPTDPDTWTLSGDLVVPNGLEVVAGAVTVALVPFQEDATNIEGAGLAFGDPWVLGLTDPLPAGGSIDFTMEVPRTPPLDLQYTVDGYPGLALGTFFGGAWVDADGDGLADPEETYVSSQFDLFYYVAGVLPAGLAAIGLESGWNFVVVDPLSGATSVTPFAGDFPGWALEANLLPFAGRGELSAHLPGGYGADGITKLGLYALNEFLYEPAPADATLSAVDVGFSPNGRTLDVPTVVPPADVLMSELDGYDLGGVDIALTSPVLFADVDGDGDWVLPEPPVLVAPETEAVAVYVRPTGFGAWLYAATFGGTGWMLWIDDDGNTVSVPWSEGVELSAP